MNKKERKKRLWKASFRRKYQQQIWKVIEAATGNPPETNCVFIANMAKRLSHGKLQIQEGIIVHDDELGPKDSPMMSSHCWNVMDGQRFDLSPWGDKPRVEYFTSEDGKAYEWYRAQTIPFGNVSQELLDKDVNHLMELLKFSMSGCEIVTPFSVVDDAARTENHPLSGCNSFV